MMKNRSLLCQILPPLEVESILFIVIFSFFNHRITMHHLLRALVVASVGVGIRAAIHSSRASTQTNSRNTREKNDVRPHRQKSRVRHQPTSPPPKSASPPPKYEFDGCVSVKAYVVALNRICYQELKGHQIFQYDVDDVCCLLFNRLHTTAHNYKQSHNTAYQNCPNSAPIKCTIDHEKGGC